MQLDAVTLPDSLQWVNEYEHNASAQSVERSLSGALLVQEAALLYGRPITLAGGPDGGWIDRATADALFALAATPGRVMTLTGLPQTGALAVIFDRSQGPAIEAQMVMRYAYPDAGTWYTLQLRLLTVAPA